MGTYILNLVGLSPLTPLHFLVALLTSYVTDPMCVCFSGSCIWLAFSTSADRQPCSSTSVMRSVLPFSVSFPPRLISACVINRKPNNHSIVTVLSILLICVLRYSSEVTAPNLLQSIHSPVPRLKDTSSISKPVSLQSTNSCRDVRWELPDSLAASCVSSPRLRLLKSGK